MTRRLIAAGLMLSVIVATTARADYDEKQVKKIVEAVQQHKNVAEYAAYPKAETQVVRFAIEGSPTLTYVIDLRAQLCFLFTNPVPCAALKRGYPLMAPIITWVDAPAEPAGALGASGAAATPSR